ncbi:hypothetical protein, partial [Janthinobacterium sp. PSRC2-1]|uniref:hypothetical protein n=1 Tax=Janthinobacterium sp. PSRC2-1 TaxID=2804587 RepID=UPI003CFBC08C
DNAQFKSQTVIALAAPKPLFHLTLLLCIEKVSTYSRMGHVHKKRAEPLVLPFRVNCLLKY